MKTKNKAALSILKSCKLEELQFLAKRSNNTKALTLFLKGDSFEEVTLYLGLEADFKKYLKQYGEVLITLSENEATKIMDEFYYYILEKICFPDVQGLPKD